MAGTVGQRFGSSKKFGALFSGSYDYNGRGINDIEPTPDPNFASPSTTASTSVNTGKRTRYGFGGSLDYKFGEGSGLYLHYFLSDFKDYGDKWVYTLTMAEDLRRSRPHLVCPTMASATWPSAANMSSRISWLSWELSASRARQTAAAGNPGADFQPVPQLLAVVTPFVPTEPPKFTCPS